MPKEKTGSGYTKNINQLADVLVNRRTRRCLTLGQRPESLNEFGKTAKIRKRIFHCFVGFSFSSYDRLPNESSYVSNRVLATLFSHWQRINTTMGFVNKWKRSRLRRRRGANRFVQLPSEQAVPGRRLPPCQWSQTSEQLLLKLRPIAHYTPRGQRPRRRWLWELASLGAGRSPKAPHSPQQRSLARVDI